MFSKVEKKAFVRPQKGIFKKPIGRLFEAKRVSVEFFVMTILLQCNS